jgi:hypothetical protein
MHSSLDLFVPIVERQAEATDPLKVAKVEHHPANYPDGAVLLHETKLGHSLVLSTPLFVNCKERPSLVHQVGLDSLRQAGLVRREEPVQKEQIHVYFQVYRGSIRAQQIL